MPPPRESRPAPATPTGYGSTPTARRPGRPPNAASSKPSASPAPSKQAQHTRTGSLHATTPTPTPARASPASRPNINSARKGRPAGILAMAQESLNKLESMKDAPSEQILEQFDRLKRIRDLEGPGRSLEEILTPEISAIVGSAHVSMLKQYWSNVPEATLQKQFGGSLNVLSFVNLLRELAADYTFTEALPRLVAARQERCRGRPGENGSFVSKDVEKALEALRRSDQNSVAARVSSTPATPMASARDTEDALKKRKRNSLLGDEKHPDQIPPAAKRKSDAVGRSGGTPGVGRHKSSAAGEEDDEEDNSSQDEIVVRPPDDAKSDAEDSVMGNSVSGSDKVSLIGNGLRQDVEMKTAVSDANPNKNVARPQTPMERAGDKDSEVVHRNLTGRRSPPTHLDGQANDAHLTDDDRRKKEAADSLAALLTGGSQQHGGGDRPNQRGPRVPIAPMGQPSTRLPTTQSSSAAPNGPAMAGKPQNQTPMDTSLSSPPLLAPPARRPPLSASPSQDIPAATPEGALASLADGKWLSTTAIELGIKLFLPPACRYHDPACINVEYPRSPSKPVEARKHGTTLIFQPVNMLAQHWVLAIFDLENRVIELLDSMANNPLVPAGMRAKVVRALQVYARGIVLPSRVSPAHGSGERDWTVKYVPCAPLCPGPSGELDDCGVYVVAYAMYRMAGLPQPRTLPAVRWRRILRAALKAMATATGDPDQGRLTRAVMEGLVPAPSEMPANENFRFMVRDTACPTERRSSDSVMQGALGAPGELDEEELLNSVLRENHERASRVLKEVERVRSEVAEEAEGLQTLLGWMEERLEEVDERVGALELQLVRKSIEVAERRGGLAEWDRLVSQAMEKQLGDAKSRRRSRRSSLIGQGPAIEALEQGRTEAQEAVRKAEADIGRIEAEKAVLMRQVMEMEAAVVQCSAEVDGITKRKTAAEQWAEGAKRRWASLLLKDGPPPPSSTSATLSRTNKAERKRHSGEDDAMAGARESASEDGAGGAR